MPFSRGVKLLKLKEGKKRQSFSLTSFPVESKIEDSSKMYLSDDLSWPALISNTLSCNPAITFLFNVDKINDHTCSFSNGEPDLFSRLVETIFLRSDKVLPENTRPYPEIGILSRLLIQEVLKLSWISLDLLWHEESPDILTLAPLVFSQPHIPLQPIGRGESTANQL